MKKHFIASLSKSTKRGTKKRSHRRSRSTRKRRWNYS